jgi:X-Pro dipeptidyl-peptidase
MTRLFLQISVLFFLLICKNVFAQEQIPQPIFKNGEAQVVPEFNDTDTWIKEELWVETTFDSDSDGKPDRMHVYVTRQSQTESGQLQLPVVYMPSPYYGLKLWPLLGFSTSKNYWKVKHELGETPKKHRHTNLGTRKKRPFWAGSYDMAWIPRGYITVYSSSPGTGLSDGAPTVGGENESLASKAVIDWLCGRAKAYKTRTGNEEVTAFWSSGKIGMMGTSYNGTLCIAAATTGAEGLEAIIPVAPVTSFYEYYRSNGLVRSPGGYVGEDMDVLYDLINTGDKSKRKKNDLAIRDSILVPGEDRVTGDYNAFWDSHDYLKKIDNMKCAMLMAHAFNDWNVMPEQSIRFYEAAKAKGLPVQLYFHQGAHGGDPSFTMMNRWFTRYLHGIENGVENDPPVQIVREFKKKPTPYSAYPDENAEDVTFYPQTGNRNTGTITLHEKVSGSKDSLTDNYKISGKELVEEKNADHRLLYLSPTLTNDLRISGTATIKIRLASSKPAANLSVWLVSLPWEDEKGTKIYENVITRAWADPQNYKSLSEGEALLPGQFYDLSFNFMPDDQVIQKGQQIGLMIFSSDKEFTLWPEPGTELTIDLDGTSFTLPIVGGKEAYENAVR